MRRNPAEEAAALVEEAVRAVLLARHQAWVAEAYALLQERCRLARELDDPSLLPTQPEPNWMRERGGPALIGCLEIAVPMWIERLRWFSWASIEARAKDLQDWLVSSSEGLLFKMGPGKNSVGTRESFNRLAQVVACLAFAPGGVRLFGCHFEATLATKAELEQAGR